MFDSLFCFQNLIDQLVLDVDAPGIDPAQVANQFS
jgi:hypothetical protein